MHRRFPKARTRHRTDWRTVAELAWSSGIYIGTMMAMILAARMLAFG